MQGSLQYRGVQRQITLQQSEIKSLEGELAQIFQVQDDALVIKGQRLTRIALEHGIITL